MIRTTRCRIWKGSKHWYVMDKTGCFVGSYLTWDAAMHAAAQS